MTTKYRVYEAPDGSSLSYCGEYDTYDEAVAAAETESGGLEEAAWATAHAAGHVAGMTAPEGGVEGDEAISWHGVSGWHCVVEVTF